MPAKLKPRRYRDNGTCTAACSYNPRNLPPGAPEAIHRWIEQGCNNERVVANCREMGWLENRSLSERSLARHKGRHMTPAELMTEFGNEPVELDPSEPAERGQKLSDLAILDKIIQAGSRQLASQAVRITPEMTMKAMELRLKLTQGSVFDDFLAAVGQAFNDAPPEGPGEAAEAVASDDERAQRGTDGEV